MASNDSAAYVLFLYVLPVFFLIGHAFSDEIILKNIISNITGL